MNTAAPATASSHKPPPHFFKLDPKLVWHPIPNNPIPPAVQSIQGKICYQTTQICEPFWQALQVNWIASHTHTAAVVAPVIIRDTAEKDVYKTLIRKHPTHPRPITSYWLTHDKKRTNWTTEETHEHMVNQTMFHLREHIKLSKPHKNPLKTWSDAYWVYSWKRLNSAEALNTWLVFIKFNPVLGT